LRDEAISGEYYFWDFSDGTGSCAFEFSALYVDADPGVLTCAYEDVPLYIKNITEKTLRNDRVIQAAVIWRLKIGK